MFGERNPRYKPEREHRAFTKIGPVDRAIQRARNFIEEYTSGPRIAIEFLFTPHGTTEDFEKLEGKFREADIYVPEGVNWSLDTFDNLRDVSRGRITPDNFLESAPPRKNMEGAARKFLEIVYGSNKAVGYIDLDSGHPNVEKHTKSLTSRVFAGTEINFETGLEHSRTKLKEEMETQKEREAYILFGLDFRIRGIIKEYPELQKKKHIKILVHMGSFHTALYQELQKRGWDVTRTFSQSPYIYDYQTEVFRRHHFGKNIDDLVLARAMFEGVLPTSHLPETMRSRSDIRAKYYRYVVSHYTLEEIKQIFELKRQGDPSAINRSMKQKGIKIPQTEEELDRLLKLPEKHVAA